MTTSNIPGATPLPREADVRELVAAIVDGVIGHEPFQSEPDGATAVPAPSGVAIPADGVATNRIAIGADHGGYPLKEHLLFRLREAGFEVVD